MHCFEWDNKLFPETIHLLKMLPGQTWCIVCETGYNMSTG